MNNPQLILASNILASFKETLNTKPLKLILVFKSNSANSILQYEYEVENVHYFVNELNSNVNFTLSKSHGLIEQQICNIHGFFLNKNYYFTVLENDTKKINEKELSLTINKNCYDTFPHINHFLITGNIKFLPNT